MYLSLAFIFSIGTILGAFAGRLYGMLLTDAFCLIGFPVGYIATASCVLFLLALLDEDLHGLRRRRGRANAGESRREGGERAGSL